ncbi:MAG TPA: hypothetical protein VNI36_08580 [Candidatus Dormibacteraeota bacterium]|nr:hypothetical protein [Candidatus Dormibacteraeota bacterium]
MTLPGWDSLDSVIHVTTLCFWGALVACEVVAHVWHRKRHIFNVLALIAFAVAVVGEVADYKYDGRKQGLYDAQEQSLTNYFNSKLQKNNTVAQNAKAEAQQAHSEAQHSADDANQAHQLASAAEQETRTLKYEQGYRELSEDQKAQLIAFLKPYAPQKYYFICAQDAEATEYADEIVEALKSAGWEAVGPGYNWGTITHQGEGVWVEVSDVNKPAPHGAAVLQMALRKVGIDAGGASFPMVGEDGFLLYVGLRPKPKQPSQAKQN